MSHESDTENILIKHGRDFKYTLFVQNSDGSPKDLTGFSFVRVRKKNADGSILTLLEPLTAAVNEVQSISFPVTPTVGSYKLQHPTSLEKTPLILFGDTAATIEGYLQALGVFSSVTVAGDQTSGGGLVITYGGNDGGRDQDLLVVTDNTLTDGANAVVPVPAATTEGVGANGITVVNAVCGELLVEGSEAEATPLKVRDDQKADLLIRIGAEDLPTEDTIIYDVVAQPV